MKKSYVVLLISVFCFFCVEANAAETKCKFAVDKTDPFTGKHVLMTSDFIVNMILLNYKWQILFQKNGDDYSVGSFIMLGGKLVDNIEKGDSIMIKFADGRLITLHSNNQVTPRFTEISNSKFLTSYESYYTVSIEDLKEFSTSLMTFVKINTGSKIYQQEVNEKNAMKIKASASCIIQ